jgi:integrase
MASLREIKLAKDEEISFVICFRYGRRLYNRSLGRVSKADAEARCKRVEATLHDLATGRIPPPPEGADAGLYVLSDGKLTDKPKPPAPKQSGLAQPAVTGPVSLRELWDAYRADLPTNAKEQSSQDTEALHVKHLLTILKGDTPFAGLKVDDLQRYITRRGKQKGFRGNVKPRTIKKEIATLKMLWNTYALPRKLVLADFKRHFGQLRYNKEDEKPAFQTWEQIERLIERGGLDADQQAALWDCLYLDVGRIGQVLDHVSQYPDKPAWVYPMFVYAAQTGARRSEIARTRIEDWDQATLTIQLRERKRSSEMTTFRPVSVLPRLATVIEAYLADHLGGQLLFCDRPNEMLTRNSLNYWFGRVLEGSKWHVLRGWHLFRHSFASNCAAAGIDQRTIDATLGHSTEEMKRRYRHLFPNRQRDALASVFGS